jgi:hypothetical protein
MLSGRFIENDKIEKQYQRDKKAVIINSTRITPSEFNLIDILH